MPHLKGFNWSHKDMNLLFCQPTQLDYSIEQFWTEVFAIIFRIECSYWSEFHPYVWSSLIIRSLEKKKILVNIFLSYEVISQNYSFTFWVKFDPLLKKWYYHKQISTCFQREILRPSQLANIHLQYMSFWWTVCLF